MPDTASTPLPDYYEVLQVSPNADTEIIQAAYKRLVDKWQNDRRPGDSAAFERLALLNEATTILSDPAKRRGYDSRRPQPDTGDVVPAIVVQGAPESVPVSKSAPRWPRWPAVMLALSAIVFVCCMANRKEEPQPPSSQDNEIADLIESLRPGVETKKQSIDSSPRTPKPSTETLFARISPSVVQVVIHDRQGRTVGSGSGFILDQQGLIATRTTM